MSDASASRTSSAWVAILALTLVAVAWTRSPSVFPEWAWAADAALLLATLASVRARPLPCGAAGPLVIVSAVVIVLSNAVAPDAGAALVSTADWARLLLTAWIGMGLALDARESERVAWVLAAAGAAASAHAALQVAVIHPGLAQLEGLPTTVRMSLLDARGNSVFLLPAHLGAFLAMALPSAVGLALVTRRAGRALATLLAGAIVAGLFVAGSMGGALLAGLGLGTLGLVGLVRLDGRRRAAVMALALILPLAIIAPSRLRRQAEIAREEPGSARAANWASAARLIRESPVLGGGGGSFAIEHERVRAASENDAKHAHQAYLESAAEHGVALLPLLAALVAAVTAGAWRHRRRARDEAGSVAVAALHAAAGCALAQGLIDFGWSDPAWALPAALVVGASLGAAGVTAPGAGAAESAARGGARGIAALRIALAAGVLVVSALASRAASLERVARARAEAGRLDEARAALERAARLAPLDADVAGALGGTLLAMAADGSRPEAERARLREAAVDAARRAVACSPRAPAPRLLLARALVADARTLEALTQASRAAQLAPHRKQALELRNELARAAGLAP